MKRRENSYWWDRGRRDLVLSFVKKSKKLTEKSVIFDAGCGPGLMLHALNKKFPNLLGSDFSKEALKICRSRGLKKVRYENFEQGLKAPNKQFDAVLCLEVLEHVENHENLIREFRRVLKKGGELFITVPAYQFLWSHHDEILWHKRRYKLKQLTELLEKNGFKIKKATYFYIYLLPIAISMFVLFKKRTAHMKSDSIEVGGVFNYLLFLVTKAEKQLLKFISLPFGLSIFVAAEKI